MGSRPRSWQNCEPNLNDFKNSDLDQLHRQQKHNKRMQSDASKAGAADAGRYVF